MSQDKDPGFNVIDILNLAHVLPAILHVDYHYKAELFAGDLYKVAPHLGELLNSIEILDTSGKVTGLGAALYAQIHLFYYLNDIQDDLVRSKKPKKSLTKYRTLRRGLGEQALYNGPEFTSWVNSFVHGPKKILDLCGGDGTYLRMLLDVFPTARGVLVDKNLKEANQHAHPRLLTEKYDIISNEFTIRANHDGPIYDVVLVNEVLHLKGPTFHRYIFSLVHRMLIPGGFMIIGECEPTPSFEWRMKAFTDGGAGIPMNALMDLIAQCPHYHDNVQVLSTSSHYYLGVLHDDNPE